MQTQNLRSIWDLATKYSPYTKSLNALYERTDDKKIILELGGLAFGLWTVVRFVTPLYARALNKRLTYDLIQAMITSGEIGSTFVLRLLLMEIPQNKRDPEKEVKLIEMLPESKKRLSYAEIGIAEAVSIRDNAGILPPHDESIEKDPEQQEPSDQPGE